MNSPKLKVNHLTITNDSVQKYWQNLTTMMKCKNVKFTYERNTDSHLLIDTNSIMWTGKFISRK